MRENVDLHKFWILLASAVVLVLLSSVSMAAEITVDDNDESKDYTTIQAAVNAAADEDTILVYPGDYTENVNVDKELNITSVGDASVTHVKAADPTDHVFDIRDKNNVTIDGFSISGATENNKASILLLRAKYCNITNNNISNSNNGIILHTSSKYNNLVDNHLSGNDGNGIYLLAVDYNNLTNNVLSQNNNGIYLSSSGNNNLANNVVTRNTNGIYLSNSPSNELIDNTILDNDGNGIKLDKSYYNNLTHNNVSNNTDKGIYLSYSHYNNLTDNTLLDNNNKGSLAIGGLHLKTSSNNFMENNNISNNGYHGIYIDNSEDNTISKNTLSNNVEYGISFGSGSASYRHNISDNILSNNEHGGMSLKCINGYIYNNYFNNSDNVYISATSSNRWNTTNTTGPNIIGGPYIGGNFWANPDGTGFSQLNTDSDGDGFCDTPNDNYKISEWYDQYDYLPLASTVTDDEPPVVVPIAPLGKEVGPGETLELNVSVTDDSDLSSVVVNVSSVNDTVDTAFLTNVNGYWVNNSITLDVNPHGEYNLSINATDEFGNSNTSMKLSVIGESTSTGDGNEDDGGNPVYHPQPLFDVPTGNPLLLVGVLGIAVMFFVRRRE